MNLIEQLGGYETAKKKANDKGIGFLLSKELLEYRRANNIYEIGDLIKYDAFFNNGRKEGFGVITYIDHDMESVKIDFKIGVALSEIRHPTDSEIEANKKEDLNNGKV